MGHQPAGKIEKGDRAVRAQSGAQKSGALGKGGPRQVKPRDIQLTDVHRAMVFPGQGLHAVGKQVEGIDAQLARGDVLPHLFHKAQKIGLAAAAGGIECGQFGPRCRKISQEGRRGGGPAACFALPLVLVPFLIGSPAGFPVAKLNGKKLGPADFVFPLQMNPPESFPGQISRSDRRDGKYYNINL